MEELIMSPENVSNVLKILNVSENPLEFLEIVAMEFRDSQFYHNADWRKVLLNIFEKESLFSEQRSEIQTKCIASEEPEDNLAYTTCKTYDTDNSFDHSLCMPQTQASVDRSVIDSKPDIVNGCSSSKDQSLESEDDLFGFSPQSDSILSDNPKPNDLSLLLEPEFHGFSSPARRPTRIFENSNIFEETLPHYKEQSTILPLSERNASPTVDLNNNMIKSVADEDIHGVKSVFKETFIHVCEIESETKLRIIKIIDSNNSITDSSNVSTLFPVNKPESERRPKRSSRSTSANKSSGRNKYDLSNSDKENKTSSQPADKRINRSRSFKTFKPKILFTKCDSAPYTSLIRLLGGQEVHSPMDCNILVSNKVHTTYKFLSVIALGSPIISENWLREMQKSGQFIPYDKYALSDLESEKRYKFVLSKALAAARKKPLYRNYSILVTANTQPRPEELCTIIECAGGRLLTEESRPGDELLAISTTEDSRDWPSIQKLFPGITIINTKGFMISIMNQKLNFSKCFVLA